MIRKIILFVFLIQSFFISNAQESVFSVQEFYDTFDEESYNNWRVINSADNLYLIENGNYELYRRNVKTADVIFSKWENTFKDFEIRLNLKFEKNKNKDQYAGIIFKASKTSALIAEIHQDAKVRIRMITDGKSSFVTGLPEEDGWVKFKSIKKEFNALYVQADSNTYAVFLNGVKLISIIQEGFTTGRMGLVIGTDTKVRIDNFGVYSREKINEVLPETKVSSEEQVVTNNQEVVDSALLFKGNPGHENKGDTTRKAVPGKTANNKKPVTTTTANKPKPVVKPATNAELTALQKKIDELTVQVNQFRNKMYQQQDRADSLQSILDLDGKKDYREENKRVVTENKILDRMNDSLLVLMRTYDDVRAALSKTEGSEISMKLAGKLRQEKAARDESEKRNKELELQNKKLTLRVKSLEAQVDKMKQEKQATPKKK